MSAAKRYRLRCLKAVILALAAPDAPALEPLAGLDEEMAALPAEERAKQVRDQGGRVCVVVLVEGGGGFPA